MILLKNLNKKFKIFSNIRKHLNLSHKTILPFMEAEIKNPVEKADTFRGVPETMRFKPIAEFSLRNILRVQAIQKNISTLHNWFVGGQELSGN